MTYTAVYSKNKQNKNQKHTNKTSKKTNKQKTNKQKQNKDINQTILVNWYLSFYV